MNQLGLLVTVVGGLLVLLAGAASVVAYFKASYARATIETLRDSNLALTGRVGELEASEDRLKLRCDALEREAVNLRSYVSGTEAVNALAAKIDAYQGELHEHRREVITRLDRLTGRPPQ